MYPYQLVQLYCIIINVAGNKDKPLQLKGFYFGYILVADIVVIWPWTIDFLLENCSKYFDAYTCCISNERPLPVWYSCLYFLCVGLCAYKLKHTPFK